MILFLKSAVINQGRLYFKYLSPSFQCHKVHFFEGRVFCVFDPLALGTFSPDADVAGVSTLGNQRDKIRWYFHLLKSTVECVCTCEFPGRKDVLKKTPPNDSHDL